MKRTASVLMILLVLPLLTGGDRESSADYPVGKWAGVPRVVAVGDVHGAYGKLVTLLTSSKLIDESHSWIGGEDHLVIVGDFLDRQPGDRQIVEMLMRLQQESVAAGGRVHALLGNHEVMNLVRDMRFVNSYAAWADDETPAMRRAAKREFLVRQPVRGPRPRAEKFEERFPRGYFVRPAEFLPRRPCSSFSFFLPLA